jgi:hypothetical protein
MTHEELTRRELALKVEKLEIETRELRSGWHRVGRWVPLLVAVVSIGYSVAILDAKRTINEAAAVRAKNEQQLAEQQLAQARDEEEAARKELERLVEARARLEADAQELRLAAEEAAASVQRAETALARVRRQQLSGATPSVLGTAELQQSQQVLQRLAAYSEMAFPEARVYSHIFDEGQRGEAQRAGRVIEAERLGRFFGVENVAPKQARPPSRPQVRYFNRQDREAAETIAERISTVDTRYSALHVTAVRGSPGTIEIWLPAG